MKNNRSNSDRLLGISIGANGGMNTEYAAAVFSAFDNPGGTATSPTGIDFKQLFIGLTYARKITASHSFGITPIAAAQSFKVTGLQPFQPFSADPEHVTNNGYDYSFGGGLKIGGLSRITDTFSLGLSYQTKLWMSRFDAYRGLFAEQGNFDIPANFTAGLAWKITPALTLAVDVQRIFFSGVDAIANSGNMALQPGAIRLGTDDGIGFGWQDMTVGKFGLQWQCRPNLTLRAGYSTSNQTIPDEQALFNILAPAVVTEHYTLGLTRTFAAMDLSLSLLYAPENRVSGTNPNTGPQTGSLEMNQYEVEIGVGFPF
ncbi:MAG: outer membrane protein transport protein [Desulfobulbaceae bacterium]|nr:outer membrane protein transport protein [Desulfobulbaceae bacterium]